MRSDCSFRKSSLFKEPERSAPKRCLGVERCFPSISSCLFVRPFHLRSAEQEYAVVLGFFYVLFVNVLIFVFVFAVVLVSVFMGLYLVRLHTKARFVIVLCLLSFYLSLEISKYLTRPEVEAFFISSSGLVYTFDTRASTCTNS